MRVWPRCVGCLKNQICSEKTRLLKPEPETEPETRTLLLKLPASAGQLQWGLYIRLAQRHRVHNWHGMARWKGHSQGPTAVVAVPIVHTMRKSLTVLKFDPPKRP